MSIGSPAEVHLERLAARHPGARSTTLPSGTRAVVLPDLPLPAGWNRPATTVTFLVPPGYPFAPPDCFWADGELRLADGRLPQNSQLGNPIPEVGGAYLWFSWHLNQAWNPNRDTLETWLNVVNARFRSLS